MADEPDITDIAIAALTGLPRPVKVSLDGYTAVDRYRDFNRVFFGTDEGKRVISQILDLCNGHRVFEDELGNHALLVARVWGRHIGNEIMEWASKPPKIER